MSESQILKVKGEPTKELFVHILTRDIALHAAVVELLDNSADGAKRVADNPDDLSAYQVDIDFDAERFRISDNCGGIPLPTATDYAFRFGRAEGMPRLRGSIGEFGVGMKRALFSFGRHYVIDSATTNDWFLLSVDLNLWIQDKTSWDFDLNQYGPNEGDKLIGTRIEVTDLTEDAARQFALENFRTRVENEIKQKHSLFISRGLVIKVCGKTIPRDEWQLVFDDDFKPAYQEEMYERPDREPVKLRLYAGLGRSSPSDAGWYVICNGRLILNADKSDKTGWGWESLNAEPVDIDIPRYHNQFARFRGYALFDSAEAAGLPWNSMKTDVDPDHPIWLNARDEMVAMMRPIIDFLNTVDAEAQLPDNERPFTSALRSAPLRPISQVSTQQAFRYPPKLKKPRPQMVTIQFRKEIDRVDELREAMGTSSARDTGDAAFEEAYRKYIMGN